MAKNESKASKSYKGIAMEGFIARWYANSQKNSKEQYKTWAIQVAENMAEGEHVLEVAPGPGYLSIEIAKLGNYNVTGLDISKTFVEIAQSNANKAGVKAKFKYGDALICLLIMKHSISLYVQQHSRILQNQLLR